MERQKSVSNESYTLCYTSHREPVCTLPQAQPNNVCIIRVERKCFSQNSLTYARKSIALSERKYSSSSLHFLHLETSAAPMRVRGDPSADLPLTSPRSSSGLVRPGSGPIHDKAPLLSETLNY